MGTMTTFDFAVYNYNIKGKCITSIQKYNLGIAKDTSIGGTMEV
jgi:hypothetical protein